MKNEVIAILGTIGTIGVISLPHVVEAGWIDPTTASAIGGFLAAIATAFGRSQVYSKKSYEAKK